MSKDIKDIEKKVIGVLADSLDIDPKKIKLDSRLMEDLGFDSFGAIEMVFKLEDKFGLEILEDDIKKMRTVEDIVDYINQNMQNK